MGAAFFAFKSNQINQIKMTNQINNLTSAVERGELIGDGILSIRRNASGKFDLMSIYDDETCGDEFNTILDVREYLLMVDAELNDWIIHI